MKKSIWFVLSFISCLMVGMLTRGAAKQIPYYGFHAVLAALPVSFLLRLCFGNLDDKPIWVQIIPILLFGVLMGMMSPVMLFYNIGAIALAAVLTYIVKWDKSSVLAFGYAFLSYPLAILSGKLFSKSTVEVGIVELLLILMLTGALSLLGTLVGKWIAEKGANKA